MNKMMEIWKKITVVELDCPFCGQKFKFSTAALNPRSHCETCHKDIFVQMRPSSILLLALVGMMVYLPFFEWMSANNFPFLFIVLILVAYINLYATIMYRLMLMIFKPFQVFNIKEAKKKK